MGGALQSAPMVKARCLHSIRRWFMKREMLGFDFFA